jgi:hypothetical protein
MDWFYPVVGTIGALGLLAFMAWMPYLLKNYRYRSDNVEYVAVKPYKEYSTADAINRYWMAEDRIGVKCQYCGMDDCPIVLRHPLLDQDLWGFSLGGPKCKWCVELHNINYHLSTNGVRRLRKV